MPAEPANLPWVEKYRPSTLDELISHEEIIKTLRQFVEKNRLPHLLFYGPPGTGKTTTILAIARQLYGAEDFRKQVLELNASDERGIGVVRNEIVNFSSARSFAADGAPKLVILDEADAMTKEAQNALRRVIEKYTGHVRFCLIGNYMQKIIPAIQSRCTRFRFAPLRNEQIRPRLEHVIACEHVDATADGIDALLTLCRGDMRKALNVLQCTYLAYNKRVSVDTVYDSVGHPRPAEIEQMVKWMLNESVAAAYEHVQGLKYSHSYALQDIVTDVARYLDQLEIPRTVRIFLLRKIAELEYRLTTSENEKLQLCSLIAAFQQCRDQIVGMAVDG